MQIDLIWLTRQLESQPIWSLGQTWVTLPKPAAISQTIEKALQTGTATHYLFWHDALASPAKETIKQLLTLPGDAWHAGLVVGTKGLPHLIDFVNPVWRFTRDPDPQIVATSWRLSLNACLVKVEVLQQLGGPDPTFDTLCGAGLEMGHRWLRRGAILSNVPTLVEAGAASKISEKDMTLPDEFRFVRYRYGRMWANWAFFRAWVNKVAPASQLMKSWLAAKQKAPTYPQKTPFFRQDGDISLKRDTTVSVLIPTLDRYPYLFRVLDQLRCQTYPPHEIIVVDQTEANKRHLNWPQQFEDLPLHVIWRDQPGQCSSRNAGLQDATGEIILFLDDDDEIKPDLIETHLKFMVAFNVDASCGVAEEIGAGKLPYDFTYTRSSDVFPTNNSLLSREALLHSGLFDLAYEVGSRADGDLGMRLYLSGQFLVLNPEASVIHHHAPRGGLRQHKAREITRSGSKNSIFQRQLLEPTEAYLWSRYFTDIQVREAVLIRSLSTVRGVGSRWQRIMRFVLMSLYLPITWHQNHVRMRIGKTLKENYPRIPALKLEEEES